MAEKTAQHPKTSSSQKKELSSMMVSMPAVVPEAESKDTALERAIQCFTDKETADVWFDYAKQRFDEVSGRIDGYRSTSRQMVAWIAVVLGLELSYLPKLLDGQVVKPTLLWLICVMIAFLPMIIQ